MGSYCFLRSKVSGNGQSLKVPALGDSNITYCNIYIIEIRI